MSAELMLDSNECAMNEHIQVLIVDDHPLFRDGVVQTLHADPDIDIVGQAKTAAEAVQLANELVPDVILLDITIPGGGLYAAQKIAATLPVAKIIMLTASEAEEDVLTALKAGARGYILKGVSGDELLRIVHSVYDGEAYVTPSLAVTLLAEMQNQRRVSPPVGRSTNLPSENGRFWKRLPRA